MKNIPPLLAISDRLGLSGSLEEWLDALAKDGVPMVQLREKDLPDRALFELAVVARRRLPPEVPLLINGRIDIALAAGCEGVHLPAASPPTAIYRRRFGDGVWIGRSTHAPEEVAREARQGADYVTFGPLFPTPSKVEYGPPPGIEGLRAARRAAPALPIFALGGVFPEHLPRLGAADAGAHGAAGIRTFQDPELRRAMVAAARDAFPWHREAF